MKNRTTKVHLANRTPVAMPTAEAISQAIDVLRDQQLHYYQLLHFEGLADPHGYPFMVRRKTYSPMFHNTTVVEIVPSFDAKWSFCVRPDDAGPEQDATIIKWARMLMAAKDKPVKLYACCPYAEVRNCVCVASYECPIHGKMCVGSHD